MSSAIFLDRDGVIIENRPNYVRSWADVDIYPQALTALSNLSHTLYKLIIVTNQSAVGRGIISLATAQGINERLVQVIERENGRIDAAYLCPHAPQAGCACRKPKPGMLLQAAQEHHLDLSRSIMIGDALTDLEAGLAAGLSKVILLRTGRGEEQAKLPAAANFSPLYLHDDLLSAVQSLGDDLQNV